jgi:hypothetical protein
LARPEIAGFGVWAASAAPETTPEGGGRRPPPSGMVFGAAGASQTQNLQNLGSNFRRLDTVLQVLGSSFRGPDSPCHLQRGVSRDPGRPGTGYTSSRLGSQIFPAIARGYPASARQLTSSAEVRCSRSKATIGALRLVLVRGLMVGRCNSRRFRRWTSWCTA